MRIRAINLGLAALAFFCTAALWSQESPGPAEMPGLFVSPGENWTEASRVFIFRIKKEPQMAAWIESEDGRFLGTLAVTSRSSEKRWRSAPKEGRPEALPVWEHARIRPAAPEDLAAVTMATPKGGLSADWDGPALTSGEGYRVFLEVNHSFDYNDEYPKKDKNGRPGTGVNGQPSLVYAASFTAGVPGTYPLEILGHGAVDGSGGEIVPKASGFTTALNIIGQAVLKVY